MFPYVPQVVRNYLIDNLDDIRIAGEVPTQMPAKLVTITTVPAGSVLSGIRQSVLSRRRLVLHCWAGDDEVAAGQLAEQVRSLLVSAPYAKVGIRGVDVVGEPARFDDRETGLPRFQLTVDVLVRSSA